MKAWAIVNRRGVIVAANTVRRTRRESIDEFLAGSTTTWERWQSWHGVRCVKVEVKVIAKGDADGCE